ncbi:MAG TPA: SDR family oxidoreductase [Acetobacteraceae bacterium]|nr:SDR family oxidoreductase [Acetobacteraceae bacterium]
MKIELAGKTAIVTGSTIGIGRAIAQGLAASGAGVVVNGRGQEGVDRAVEAISRAVPGARLRGVAADLATAEGCEALARAVPAPDILVNNMGIFEPRDFFEIDDADWSRFFETNVMSGVRLSRAYLSGMAERGWGRVVFIASESAFNIPVEMIHYGFTKTAMVAIARGLAKRMRETGVTVNSVLPGPTLSEGVAHMLREQTGGRSIEEAAAEFVKAHRPSSIIGRAASVEEVANMVVYVCSEQASATTGAALRVDGGVIDTLA